MMEYIEKDLECPHKQVGPTDTSQYDKMATIPLVSLTKILKKNIEKMRAAMGGVSKDITSRKILQKDKKIQGFKSEIKIRIYSPEEKKIRPVMVFYHGGGWVGGSLWAVEEHCKGVCDQADCVVISVEYHLAPEHPFPEGLEDSYATIKWTVAHKDELGIDPEKIIVSGDSAGGNFAAVFSFLVKERREFNIWKQILIYPATLLTPEKNTSNFIKAMCNMYLPKTELMFDYRVSPALASDFSNLPDALLTVGDQDGLLPSVRDYAHLLSEAGNTVKMIVYKDTNHAFIDNTGNCAEADDFVKEAATFIRK